MADDKPLPPSAKKLRDARKKGQVPKSRELVSATVTLAAIAFITSCAATAFGRFVELIGSTGDLLDRPLMAALSDLAPQLFAAASQLVVPLLGLVVVSAIIASIVATGGLALSLSPLAPKPEKLNPAAGLKNLFSSSNLLDVLKSMIKLVPIVMIASESLREALTPLLRLPACGLSCANSVLTASVRTLVGASAVVYLVFGLLDLGLQRWQFMRQQRMSHSEMKNERKESEGNPEILREHRRERMASFHMRSGLSEATFVISGGGFAVAMRFSKIDAKVPIAVARAEADNLPSFLQAARQRKLPVVQDGSTARKVFEKTAIGARISRDLFEPVVLCMQQIGV